MGKEVPFDKGKDVQDQEYGNKRSTTIGSRKKNAGVAMVDYRFRNGRFGISSNNFLDLPHA
jgi:hypothetical protein